MKPPGMLGLYAPWGGAGAPYPCAGYPPYGGPGGHAGAQEAYGGG